MRITNQMLANNYMNDLGNNLSNMQTIQQRMSSGQLINKASDDPFGTSKVMQINTQISENQQYNSNISDTTQWLKVTDTSLGQAGNVLQRINELLVSTGSAGYGPDEEQSVKDELNQNIDQLSQILNTTFDGKYIFGGTDGTDKPTKSTKDSTSGNEVLTYNSASATNSTPGSANVAANLTVEISQGVTINYNVTASDIMDHKATNAGGTGTSGSNLSTILSNITSHLDGNNSSGVADSTSRADLIGSDLSDIQDAIKNVSSLRTKVGAIENRMTSAQDENTSENSSLTAVLSSTDDANYAQESMNYSQAQTVYQAALQISSKILQNSLTDYLK